MIDRRKGVNAANGSGPFRDILEIPLKDHYLTVEGGRTMRRLKGVLILLLVLLMLTPIIPAGRTETKTGGKGPVIIKSYAVDKGQYGIAWKIYIEAEAPDAEMAKIASVVDQAGRGRYPTDYILLDPQYRKHLKGYLQWNTFSSVGGAMKEGDQITLRVSVIDKAGHESNEVVFRFTFVSGAKNEETLPVPFDQQNIPRIGHITINLVSPGADGKN